MLFQSELQKIISRRAFLRQSSTGLGAMALAGLLNPKLSAATANDPKVGGVLKKLQFPPKAKRIIYLFQSGAPSHLDLFDPKPKLKDMTGEELPPSVRMGQRITGMTAGQTELKCVGAAYDLKK